MQAVELTADLAARKVDELMGKTWSRRVGKFESQPGPNEGAATCSCGSGIPIQKVQVNGQEMSLVALPLIFQNLFQQGNAPDNKAADEIMAMVKIYNEIDPAVEEDVKAEVYQAYADYYRQEKRKA